MIAPREPSGSSTRANWLRKLLRYVLSNEIKPGTGYMVRRTPTGTILEIRPGSGGGFGASEYQVIEHKAEYLICKKWDSTKNEASGGEIKVAKPRELRFSLTSEIIDGFTITYSAWSEASQTRHAYYSAPYQEDQIIVPRYATEGDNKTVIWAASLDGGVKDEYGAPISLLDLNVGARAWAKQDTTI